MARVFSFNDNTTPYGKAIYVFLSEEPPQN